MSENDLWQEFERVIGGERIVGEALLPIQDAEREFDTWINSHPLDRHKLVEATLGLFVETIYLSRDRFVESLDESRASLFISLLAWYVAHFKKFRAAEIAFYSGYGNSATSMLRDIRNWAFQVAAMQTQFISWSEIHGEPDAVKSGEQTSSDPEIHKKKMGTEKKVREWAVGRRSGLKDWQELERWARYSNRETHGSLVTTLIESRDWLAGKGGLSIAPKKNMYNQKLYVSRSIELCHMVLRLLPILQVRDPFGDEWNEKWRCLDRLYVDQWSSNREEKKYMPVFGDMIATKFDFQPESTRLAIEILPQGFVQ